LLETAEDRPLNRAHVDALPQGKRLPMPDLGLGNHAWSGPEMRPRRSVDEKRMADVHVTGAAGWP